MLTGARKQQSYRIIHGDINEPIPSLPVIHTVVTSPPYYRKRNYGGSNKELGNEESVQDYVRGLVGVLNRVPLHPRGSIWVNIGDTRNARGGLLMVPEQFALAMLDAGWHLADSVIWAKVVDSTDGSVQGACMIEPVRRRLNGNGWEFFYRFVRDPKQCFCDPCAVRLPRDNCPVQEYLPRPLMKVVTSVDGRACHNVWRVPVGRTRFKHYAAFLEELVERPIAMTCPMRVSRDGLGLVERLVRMVPYDEGRAARRRQVYLGRRLRRRHEQAADGAG
jgi:DNA methylase